ncbi:MAG: helix-turn-helix domain-containing protein [Acidimicrobiales bacterium]
MGISEAGAQESLTDPLGQPVFQEVASLFRQFIAAAGNGHGAPGIAKVLAQHTGKPVIVEDPLGQVVAASGAERSRTSDEMPKRGLPVNAPHAVATFDGDRWVAVACPRGEVLGAISLLDSGEQATGVDLFELEQAATVLGWDLLHSRAVAEAEVKLWGDFATELLEDSDLARIRSHAARLGYDLDEPHRAVLVQALDPDSVDLRELVGRSAAQLDVKGLTTVRPNGVVLIVAQELKWAEFARILDLDYEAALRVGVGGLYRLEEVRRSLADAEFALTLTISAVDKPVAVFDELGVWRLLARPDANDLQQLVDTWIGPLIDYDRDHRSELLKTLVAYLNEFGALEATAAKLFVHRNSLRYRLVRISELTGWDLNDPEQRFHLDLACRAHLVRQAFDGQASTGGHGPNGGGATKASRGAHRVEGGRDAFPAKNTRSRPRRPGLT